MKKKLRDNEFLKKVGSKVRKHRKARKLSLQELGNAIGMNISNLSFLERGKTNPHLLTLKAIADVLDVDVTEFF
ncbi:MAG TPA: helix-turn-helix transcriptional regulator [Chitinophagaceae bacterium]